MYDDVHRLKDRTSIVLTCQLEMGMEMMLARLSRHMPRNSGLLFPQKHASLSFDAVYVCTLSVYQTFIAGSNHIKVLSLTSFYKIAHYAAQMLDHGMMNGVTNIKP